MQVEFENCNWLDDPCLFFLTPEAEFRLGGAVERARGTPGGLMARLHLPRTLYGISAFPAIYPSTMYYSHHPAPPSSPPSPQLQKAPPAPPAKKHVIPLTQLFSTRLPISIPISIPMERASLLLPRTYPYHIINQKIRTRRSTWFTLHYTHSNWTPAKCHLRRNQSPSLCWLVTTVV